MKKLVSVVFILFLFASCGGNAPSGSDSDVKELVLEICIDELNNQLTSQFIISELRMSPRVWGNPTYNALKKVDDEDAQKVIEKVDEQMDEMDFEVDAIRTISVDEEIGKIRCSAELQSDDGKKVNIEYTAQYTDDGELYVEVYGLK